MEKENNSFIKKYKRIVIMLCLLLVGIYILIYLTFKGDGFIYVGIDLEKRDWLTFFGAYLTFAGTMIISLIAILQSKYFTDVEKNRCKKDRMRVIQPIFSVNIDCLDEQITGTVEAFNINDPSRYSKHKNITLSIENVGEYPIRNVIIFDKYLFQLLKTNDKKTFQVAYDDSPDAERWKNYLIVILESEYERSKEGIPKLFNINYDDVDGNAMLQTFELKTFEDDKYYSLSSIKEV